MEEIAHIVHRAADRRLVLDVAFDDFAFEIGEILSRTRSANEHAEVEAAG